MAKFRTFLVELDVLLDTRLGTLALIDPKAPINAIENGYHDRLIDDWKVLTNGLVDDETFNSKYEQRDVETLKVSRSSNFVKILRNVAEEISRESTSRPDTEPLKVIVSYHPYKLSALELEAMEGVVGTFVTPDTAVELMDRDIYEITPTEMCDSFDSISLYNFDKWFSKHGPELSKKPIPRNTMFAPAIVIKKPESEQDLDLIMGMEQDNAFTLMEKALVERLDLNLIKPLYFSLSK